MTCSINWRDCRISQCTASSMACAAVDPSDCATCTSLGYQLYSHRVMITRPDLMFSCTCSCPCPVYPRDEKRPIFSDLLSRGSARENFWFARIILKDLRIGMKHESMLKLFHPRALDLYNSCSNLKTGEEQHDAIWTCQGGSRDVGGCACTYTCVDVRAVLVMFLPSVCTGCRS